MKYTTKVTAYRWLAAMLLIAVFFGGKRFASSTQAQSLSKELYTYKQVPGGAFVINNSATISLKSALDKIQESYDVSFLYDPEILESKYVHASFLQSDNLGRTLREVLTRNGLTYSQESARQYAIIPVFRPDQLRKAMQLATVSGTVTDATTGETIPGVNIAVKGTNTGTSTGPEGEYELSVASLRDTLVFSFIGYQTQEVPIDGRTVIDIAMQSQTVSGDEVVVVGYGTQRKISLIGSQSSLANEEVAQLEMSSGSLSNSLAGRLSGVVGVQRSGVPGSDASDIWIRGISTFGDASPLILVDGVERPMNSLNPDDIESLTILKDASATAVYGTRGANGVILIETKEGREGEPTINIDFYQGITQLTQIPEMADGPTYMRLANEANTTR